MRTSFKLLALPVSVLLACSSEPASGGGSGGAASSQGGSIGNAGTLSAGGTSQAGTTSTTGGASSGGASSSGGTPSAGGAVPAQGGAAGSAAGGSTGKGGSTSTGVGGSTAGGATVSGGSGGGTNPTECTRALLRSAVDNYFKALAAHDASSLPLASSVKFTENAKTMELGKDGLWKNAGALKYSHSVLDTKACQTATQAVVPDGATDIPLGLRLKLVDGKITEVETIAVRAGDYKLGGTTYASKTEAIISSNTTVKWEESVPEAQRNSYDEITAWINKYFRMFPSGVCNTTSTCKRIENGFGNFNCTDGASCTSAQPGPNNTTMVPRIMLADVETGIGVGFTMFMGNTDMHMYKMYDDKIYWVSAILGGATNSGWD